MAADDRGAALVPRDVLEIAIEASRRAGRELTDRFGHEPAGRAAMQLDAGAGRAAEAAVAGVLAKQRPEDGILAGLGSVEREGSTGLRWLVDPLDGTVNYLTGIPLFCVSVACEDSSGTVAGVVFDPMRDEWFVAVRGGHVRMDGAAAPRERPARLAAAIVTGGIECATAAEARRAAKLDKRLFRRAGQRRALGSAALELAWTAAGRFDVCFHEQRIDPWNVAAGLFLCQQTGLRVHLLPPLEEGLAPRFLAAREPLAAEVLALVGPGPKERRRAAKRAPLSAANVAAAMRRRAR